MNCGVWGGICGINIMGGRGGGGGGSSGGGAWSDGMEAAGPPELLNMGYVCWPVAVSNLCFAVLK